MAGEIVVVCPDDEPPGSWEASVFLAGPASEPPAEAPWPSPAIELLTERWNTGRLAVFLPGSRAGRAEWGEHAPSLADLVIVWAPCVPGVSRASWHDSGRVVLGVPPGMPGGHELAGRAARHAVPVATGLSATIAAALDQLGAGARREGGEREVPLRVWRTTSFQRWYTAQRSAGYLSKIENGSKPPGPDLARRCARLGR